MPTSPRSTRAGSCFSKSGFLYRCTPWPTRRQTTGRTCESPANAVPARPRTSLPQPLQAQAPDDRPHIKAVAYASSSELRLWSRHIGAQMRCSHRATVIALHASLNCAARRCDPSTLRSSVSIVAAMRRPDSLSFQLQVEGDAPAKGHRPHGKPSVRANSRLAPGAILPLAAARRLQCSAHPADCGAMRAISQCRFEILRQRDTPCHASAPS
jgi:hypothetical protein